MRKQFRNDTFAYFFEVSRSVSEKKILPGAVLFAGLVYAAVAVAFYFD